MVKYSAQKYHFFVYKKKDRTFGPVFFSKYCFLLKGNFNYVARVATFTGYHVGLNIYYAT